MLSDKWLFATEIYIRVGCFLFFFLLLASLETCYRWREWQSARLLRWTRHLSLLLVSIAIIRILFPVFLLHTALFAQQNNQGIFNQAAMPYWVKFICSVIALDIVVYFHHRLMHRFKWLWYCHRVHHIDKELDVSTGLRFHPLESLTLIAMKTFGIVFLGAPVAAVFVYEIFLNFGTLFTHSNLKLSKKLEKYLRMIVVTPGMHRIHHSDNPTEFNSNFGFCFSWWDRIFGSYRDRAFTGESRLLIGQADYRENKYQTLGALLLNPFNLKSRKPRKKIYKKRCMQMHNDEKKPLFYKENT